MNRTSNTSGDSATRSALRPGLTVNLRVGEQQTIPPGGGVIVVSEQGSATLSQRKNVLPIPAAALAVVDGREPLVLTARSHFRAVVYPLDMPNATNNLMLRAYVCDLGVLGRAARMLSGVVEVTNVGELIIGVRPIEPQTPTSWQTWRTLAVPKRPGGVDDALEIELVIRHAPPAVSGGDPTAIDVAVIGAGPVGVSAAAHAIEAGFKTVIFGEPLSFWKRGMVPVPLRSPPASTNIDTPRKGFTYAEFASRYGLGDVPRIPFHAFLAYAQDFTDRHNLPIVRQFIKVITPTHAGFLLETATGSWLAKRVVVAVGLTGMARTPKPIAEWGGAFYQAAQVRTPDVFRGRDIAVVGAAQSAAELALELVAAGAQGVHMLIRRPRIVYRSLHSPGNPLFKLLFKRIDRVFRYLPSRVQNPFLRYLLKGTVEPSLRDQIEAGSIALHANASLVSVRTTPDSRIAIELKGGQSLLVDDLVVATGYQYDVRKIPFLNELVGGRQLRHLNGVPCLDRHGQSSVPNLFFAGISAMRLIGPQCQFVFGTKKLSWRIAQKMVEEVAHG